MRKSTSTSSSVKKEIDDAKLAAMLQAQENSRGRSTRGGGIKKQKPVKKRAPKRKSDKKVGADDDSEIEVGSDGEIKEKPKKGGFHKLYHLSAPLADLVGEPTVSSGYSMISPFLRIMIPSLHTCFRKPN